MLEPDIQTRLKRLSPECPSLVERAEEYIRSQCLIPDDERVHVRLSRTDGALLFTWSPDTERNRNFLKGDAPFEEGFQLVEGTATSILVHVDSLGSAFAKVVPASEANVVEFMKERGLQGGLLTLDPETGPEVLRQSYSRIVERQPPLEKEYFGGDTIAELGASYNQYKILPSLIIPPDALLHPGQKHLLQNLMCSGEELLPLYEGTVESEYKVPPKDDLRRVLDEIHVEYEKAIAESEDAVDLCKVLRHTAALEDMVKLNSPYEDEPQVNRDEFEIIVCIAKGQAITLGERRAVVGSEEGDETWHDFAIRGPHEVLSEENSVRFVVLPPSEVQNRRLAHDFSGNPHLY